MDATAISQAARALRTRLSTSLPLVESQILIGHPSVAAKTAETATKKEQYLNLFIFRIEHSGYPADATSDDPIYLRLSCLITAFGNDEGSGANKVGAGENELRVIGAVLAALHKQPTLDVKHPNGGKDSVLQVVPASLSLENLNNVWATQLEVSHRPSVAYELALVPAPFETKVERIQRVLTTDPIVEPFPSTAPTPDDWVPEIAFGKGGEFVPGHSFEVGKQPAKVGVALSGLKNVEVELQWETWDAKNGWRPGPAKNIQIDSRTLSGSTLHDVDLPGPMIPNEKGQSMLTAQRVLKNAETGKTELLRSNHLLVSFYKDS